MNLFSVFFKKCLVCNKILPLGGIFLVILALVISLWKDRDLQNVGSFDPQPISKDGKRGLVNSHEKRVGGDMAAGGRGVAEVAISSSHRQPLPFRAKAVERAAVLGVLASGKQTMDERVGQLRGMRGIVLFTAERSAAME